MKVKGTLPLTFFLPASLPFPLPLPVPLPLSQPPPSPRRSPGRRSTSTTGFNGGAGTVERQGKGEGGANDEGQRNSPFDLSASRLLALPFALACSLTASPPSLLPPPPPPAAPA